MYNVSTLLFPKITATKNVQFFFYRKYRLSTAERSFSRAPFYKVQARACEEALSFSGRQQPPQVCEPLFNAQSRGVPGDVA